MHLCPIESFIVNHFLILLLIGLLFWKPRPSFTSLLAPRREIQKYYYVWNQLKLLSSPGSLHTSMSLKEINLTGCLA